jgi:hypothetical protein
LANHRVSSASALRSADHGVFFLPIFFTGRGEELLITCVAMHFGIASLLRG